LSLKGKRLLVVFQAILIFLKFLPAGVSEYLGILALGLLERLHATELWKLGSGDRRSKNLARANKPPVEDNLPRSDDDLSGNRLIGSSLDHPGNLTARATTQ
jgi:hypothetical protein